MNVTSRLSIGDDDKSITVRVIKRKSPEGKHGPPVNGQVGGAANTMKGQIDML